MRILSAVITMDVDLERAEVRNNELILSGFAGVNDVEARISAEELRSLFMMMLNVKILLLLFRTRQSGDDDNSGDPSAHDQAGR